MTWRGSATSRPKYFTDTRSPPCVRRDRASSSRARFSTGSTRMASRACAKPRLRSAGCPPRPRPSSSSSRAWRVSNATRTSRRTWRRWSRRGTKECRDSRIVSRTDAAARGDAMNTLPGRPRLQSVSTHRRVELTDGWKLCSTDPDGAVDPAALVALCPTWRPAVVPGTVADQLRRARSLDLDRAPNFDDRDWWYRCEFDAEPNATPGTRVLRLDGLASLANVWLNDRPVLVSHDMFVAHEVDVSGTLSERNTLVIQFRSLTAALSARRPRPRWRTKLVEHQQLRWMRTTLLGRMPGWSPPVRAVGPWRVVTLEARDFIAVENGDVRPVWDERGAAVETSLTIRELGGARVQDATLLVGDERCQLRVVSA